MHFFQKLALLLLPAAALAGVIPYETRKDFANPKSGVTSKKAFGIHAQEENDFLSYKGTQPGKVVQDGVKLRILSVGDSITVGYGKGTDGNGYRKRLRKDLSGNEVVWAGTEKTEGDMKDGHFAAWSGKTVQYINDHVDPSLEQHPNLILIHAGTNDMNSNHHVSTHGNHPQETTDRLKSMVEKMMSKCPDATIIIGMITDVCDSEWYHFQRERTKIYRGYVAKLAAELSANGSHVLAADFGPFYDMLLSDCVHPTQKGYQVLGDWWYDFIHQIPEGWIKDPVGPDPVRD
ncbi:Multidomain esterase [Fusarium oxysporum f. sp. rapae]|uniref:Multidomain esterase n=1 Tax=Fusarium oxysporum f. sp. rapae TaxID=485398 RepID=A0A8J5P0V5_FUSOX|nr:Multidomain esterase [Fusarium oxysporum f. sp. rapae]